MVREQTTIRYILFTLLFVSQPLNHSTPSALGLAIWDSHGRRYEPLRLKLHILNWSHWKNKIQKKKKEKKVTLEIQM